jgi:hypothetical protein
LQHYKNTEPVKLDTLIPLSVCGQAFKKIVREIDPKKEQTLPDTSTG